jgi:hypothetical protein
MHGPHLEKVVFPGDVAYHSEDTGTHFTCFTGTKVQILTQKRYAAGLTPYSLADFLHYNHRTGGGGKGGVGGGGSRHTPDEDSGGKFGGGGGFENVFVCGGWKEFGEAVTAAGGGQGGQSKAFASVAVPGFRTLPAGLCERVIHERDWLSAHPREVLLENRVLHLKGIYTKKTLRSLYRKDLDEASFRNDSSAHKRISVWGELDKYDARTWERSIHIHSTQAVQRLGHWLVMWAQRNGDSPDAFQVALKVFEKSFEEWPDSALPDSSRYSVYLLYWCKSTNTDAKGAVSGHRLFAIGCSRLMNRRAAMLNMTTTNKVQKKDCNTKLILEHMRLYVQFEKKLPTEMEKRIIEAYLGHPFALININLDD